MKRGIILLSLAFLLVTSLASSSCGSSTSTPTTTTTTATTNTTQTITTNAVIIPTGTASTTTTAGANVTATTTSTGNWWDSLGAPQYGGSETVSINTDITQWDPYSSGGTKVLQMYLEQIDSDNWTVNPSNFAYQIIFRPHKMGRLFGN